MLLHWFDTKEAVLLGNKLADNLTSELKKSNTKKTNGTTDTSAKAVQKTFVLFDKYKQTTKPNFYQKSKLANEFKWRLLAQGHAIDVVDALTQELIFYMK
ncbi:MAG: hypothetical protein HOP20_03780 [Sulfuriferula sp.]|nr:hypothetical protein [Sulfuriferula sp.]